jgi:hypothetical protein
MSGARGKHEAASLASRIRWGNVARLAAVGAAIPFAVVLLQGRPGRHAARLPAKPAPGPVVRPPPALRSPPRPVHRRSRTPRHLRQKQHRRGRRQGQRPPLGAGSAARAGNRGARSHPTGGSAARRRIRPRLTHATRLDVPMGARNRAACPETHPTRAPARLKRAKTRMAWPPAAANRRCSSSSVGRIPPGMRPPCVLPQLGFRRLRLSPHGLSPACAGCRRADRRSSRSACGR